VIPVIAGPYEPGGVSAAVRAADLGEVMLRAELAAAD